MANTSPYPALRTHDEPEGWRPRCPKEVKLGHLFRKNNDVSDRRAIFQVQWILPEAVILVPIYVPYGSEALMSAPTYGHLLSNKVRYVPEIPEDCYPFVTFLTPGQAPELREGRHLVLGGRTVGKRIPVHPRLLRHSAGDRPR